MPIDIDEAFINRVRALLRDMRLTVAEMLGGGSGGVPLTELTITPASGNWSTALRLTTTTRTTGNSVDQRLVALANDLDRIESALRLYLEETDRVESLNSEDATTFASRFSTPSR